mmetsp:Transcript_30768/g.35089  ORF Transcript_30768/g.35089 Transcript_30768/m.35089 type:complete len:129 (-) Transcript_30768:252-638(-)|eukprot:CAMPEP_0194136778 /NCGR_PEP_ID=MMETSP0152-20130528/6775_1 /TAXON_ID=1049557 /ORGANISM="Thalassiothrix antarctica, Strain L6-D1" /LENGTH=128 /DNA_ID=CAMNT_0038833573 /DNA_START=167 /DNA_END=553 /DNA_ORIENTATION=-
MMRNFLSIPVTMIVILLFVGIMGFQPLPSNINGAQKAATSTELNGLFDGIIKNMEKGYTGGEESPYAKQKAFDAEKRKAQLEKADARKKKGYKELKDVKKKTFAKMTYGEDEEEEEKGEEKKKLFGLF